MRIRFLFHNWHTACRALVSQPGIIRPPRASQFFWKGLGSRHTSMHRPSQDGIRTGNQAVDTGHRQEPDRAAMHAAARIYFVRADDGSCKEFRLFTKRLRVGTAAAVAVTFGYSALHLRACPTSQGYIPAAKCVSCHPFRVGCS